jgi:hypothetical protein
LCDCGYEFSGDEPEDTPTPDDLALIAARDPLATASPFREKASAVAMALFFVGAVCIAAAGQRDFRLVFFGFIMLGLACAIFSWRLFRAQRPFVAFLGVIVLLLSIACFGLSLLGPCAMAIGKPAP